MSVLEKLVDFATVASVTTAMYFLLAAFYRATRRMTWWHFGYRGGGRIGEDEAQERGDTYITDAIRLMRGVLILFLLAYLLFVTLNLDHRP